MNLGYVFEHGDGVLIATFLLLIGMSALSWYVIFWKAWSLKQEKHLLTSFKQHFMNQTDWLNAPLPHISGGHIGLLMGKWQATQPTLKAYDAAQRKEILTTQLTQTLDGIRTQMDRGLTLLASIGSSAPFIGLFGTVWGIYGALTDIATAGNASLNIVAGPMGEALVATAVGLFAAIPAVLAYNGYVRSNRLLVQEHRHIAERLMLYATLPRKGSRGNGDNLKLVSGE